MLAADRGVPRREALIEAGRTRLRPITMMTLALVAGMVPVALGRGEGADFRAPLGRAVIGGVIASTILSLLIIPTVYEIFDEWREWLFARVGRVTHELGGAVSGDVFGTRDGTRLKPNYTGELLWSSIAGIGSRLAGRSSSC